MTKNRPNVAGRSETTKPKDVAARMKELPDRYTEIIEAAIEDMIAFHALFPVNPYNPD